MTARGDYEIFLATVPGLEAALADEAREKRVRDAKAVPGGVTGKGNWAAIWRANLELRGASRVLVRVAHFHASHLADLDKHAREAPWSEFLRPDVAVRVEAACRRSKIYHSGAAEERIARAITRTIGAPCRPDGEVTVLARLDNDHCTLSVDTSGELLHKRGFKTAIAKAPMRETMAALFLRQCGFNGAEPVFDPMCGSGTFLIEAAEMAAGLKPGRWRPFAFEKLASFDRDAWEELRGAESTTPAPAVRFHGSDQDPGAIRMSRENALRAGIAEFCDFQQLEIRDVWATEGPPGLIMVNPPYGERIGDAKRLASLYRTLGRTLSQRFSGWRVGLITSEAALAEATGLPFLPPGPAVVHGSLRVRLYRTLKLS
jgi:putative N6-adenine-specific DNA methylase